MKLFDCKGGSKPFQQHSSMTQSLQIIAYIGKDVQFLSTFLSEGNHRVSPTGIEGSVNSY